MSIRNWHCTNLDGISAAEKRCFEDMLDSLTIDADRIMITDEIEAVPFEDMAHGIPPIHRVVFDESRGTTVIWGDGTRTHVRCMEGEKFERYAGFMAAVCKKMFGTTASAKRIMNKKDAALIEERRRKETEKRRAEQHERELRNINHEISRMVKRRKMELVADAIARQQVEAAGTKVFLEESTDAESPCDKEVG